MNLTPYEIQKQNERNAFQRGYEAVIKLAVNEQNPAINICKRTGQGCDNCEKFENGKTCFDLKTFKIILKWENS